MSSIEKAMTSLDIIENITRYLSWEEKFNTWDAFSLGKDSELGQHYWQVKYLQYFTPDNYMWELDDNYALKRIMTRLDETRHDEQGNLIDYFTLFKESYAKEKQKIIEDPGEFSKLRYDLRRDSEFIQFSLDTAFSQGVIFENYDEYYQGISQQIFQSLCDNYEGELKDEKDIEQSIFNDYFPNISLPPKDCKQEFAKEYARVLFELGNSVYSTTHYPFRSIAIRKDPLLCLVAATSLGDFALEHMDSKMVAKKEIAIAAVKKDIRAVKRLTPELKDDIDIAKIVAATDKFGEYFQELGMKARDNEEVALLALEKNPSNFTLLSERLQNSPEVRISYLIQGGRLEQIPGINFDNIVALLTGEDNGDNDSILELFDCTPKQLDKLVYEVSCKLLKDKSPVLPESMQNFNGLIIGKGVKSMASDRLVQLQEENPIDKAFILAYMEIVGFDKPEQLTDSEQEERREFIQSPLYQSIMKPKSLNNRLAFYQPGSDTSTQEDISHTMRSPGGH